MLPRLVPIKGGWAAVARDWAVFGKTQDEAVRRFAEAEERHAEILARPVPEPGVT